MKERLIFIAISTVILVGILLYIHQGHRKAKSAHIEEHLALLTQQIEATEENLRVFSRYAYEQVVDRPEVTELMEEAWLAPEAERGRLRNRLNEMLRPQYEHILRFHFRQVHFVFPDNRSFLRMHAPEEFGDDLSGIRSTFRLANRTRKPVSGFEEGRVYNGYRFVYPIVHGQRHSGAVEVSFSMSSFLRVLARLSPQKLRFVVRRSVVESVVFEHRQDNYVESRIAPGFLYDKGVHCGRGCEDEPLFTGMGKDVSGRMEKGDDFGFVTRKGNQDWLILFRSIRNIEGKHVAYIISANVDTEYRLMTNIHLLTTGVLLLVFLALQVFLTLFIVERQRLKELSSTDTLTRLPNRSSFISRADIEMKRSMRHGSPLSVLILDIDNFKSINDTFGHNEGDNILRKIASVLMSTLRSPDMPARWGGEEFVLLLPDTGIEGAFAIGRRLCSLIAASPVTPHRTVTVSIGATEYVQGESLEQFIDRADTALYRAKQSGRNRVEREPAA